MFLDGVVFVSSPLRAADVVGKLSSEQRLLAAVLARAIADYCGKYERGIIDGIGISQAQKRQAETWLFCRSKKEMSFCWCCEQLGYDSRRILEFAIERRKS